MSSNAYYPLHQFAGLTPIHPGFVPDLERKHHTGITVPAGNNYWGGGEFMYVQFVVPVTERQLLTIDASFDVPSGIWRHQVNPTPNTANLGKPVAVSLNAAAAGTFGWVQICGLTPVSSTASIAANTAFGLGATGQAAPISNGKQVLSARVVAPSTTTVVRKVLRGDNGSTTLQVSNTSGWFVGIYLTGTGLPAGVRVIGMDTDDQTVTLSAALTATASGDVTGVYNNGVIHYNVIEIWEPSTQGQTT